MAKNKQTQLPSLFLGLLMLVSLPAPSCQQIQLYHWMKQQPTTNVNKDASCAKKDAALSFAETYRVLNMISPDYNNDVEGQYKTIGTAFDNIPDGNTKHYVFLLLPGAVYHEKVFLSKNHLSP